MTNPPKRNHIVPQHLLRFFSEEGMTLVYDKQEDRFCRRHVRNTAVRRNHNRAKPVDLEKIFSQAAEEVEQSLEKEVLGGEYDGVAKMFLQEFGNLKKYLHQYFFPFYRDKGINVIFSDLFGSEKAFAPMENEMAKILRKIHDPKYNVIEDDLKGFSACMALIALNNPKFRKGEDTEQHPFYHPFAQMGEAVSPLLEKISQYRFRLISCDRDIFVTSDFPMLFIQMNDGDRYIRSPRNFALISKEVEFLLYIPIAPNKAIIGSPFFVNFKKDSKAMTNFIFFLNGLIWDFADRFVYAKNELELNVAKKESGVSYMVP